MIVKGYQKDGNWIYVEWSLTFIMSWDQIVHSVNAAMRLIKDYAVFYGTNESMLENATIDIRNNCGDLVAAGLLDKDTDILKVRGVIDDIAVDLTFRNQFEFMQMTFSDNGSFPDDECFAKLWLYEAFGAMLNGMEIIGNVRFAADMLSREDE